MSISRKILSDITVHMKYGRYIPELKRRETWDEIVTRNMEMHIKKYPEIEKEIRENYEYVFNKQVLPSMRSLQFGGKPIEISPNRLYNCSYLPIDDWRAFSETMFLLLGGTGVGYSVQKHHVEQLPEIRKPSPKRTRRYLVADSIEGWADAIKLLMKSYFGMNTSKPIFDYSDIRQKGAELVTSGGKAPGPQPLKNCIHNIKSILNKKEDGDKLTPLETHDIICHIADAVLAGGIRRAALISLFSLDDEEMLSCKFGNWWELNPQRGRANNSATILRHKITEDKFKELWSKIEASNSGEPGVFFTNDKDVGTNPCAEISLKANGFCNLTEVNVTVVESQEQLNKLVKAASFIGTLQAGYTDFHYLRDIWKRNAEKEALLGVSMTGIASGAVLPYDLKEASAVVVQENIRVAELIGINPAARTTSVKPSGCLLPNTPIKTNVGIKTIDEIFNINGYDLNEFKCKRDIWLEPVEKVKIFNENNEQELISKLYVNGEEDIYEIEFEDGLIIGVTGNHKFKTSNGWKRADELNDNDEIISY